MHNTLAESSVGLTLMPIAQQLRVDMSATPSQPILASELQRFLHLVLCDGRFLDQVATDPRGVANKLGFDLSPEAEAQFREKSVDQHMLELLTIKYPATLSKDVPDYVVVGILIVGVAVIVVGILDGIVVVVADTPKRPRDRSARAHLKL
jgi:hypothetical protein